MAAVNLIPDDLKIEQIQRKRLRIWILFVLAFAAASSAWCVAKFVSCKREKLSLENISRKNDQINEKILNLNEEKKQLDFWQNQFVLLADMDQYHNFRDIIDSLARISPEMIYLEKMKFSHNEQDSINTELANQNTEIPKVAKMFLTKKPENDEHKFEKQTEPTMYLSLIGTGLNYNAVADYLCVLRNMEFFHKIELKHTGRISKTNNTATNNNYQYDLNAVWFEIKCYLKTTISTVGVDYADMPKTKNL